MLKRISKTINKDFLLFLFALCLSIGSLCLQWFLHEDPCPLCLIQRWCFFSLSFLYFLNIWIKKQSVYKVFLLSVQVLFLLLGIATAVRQMWLIHHPELATTGCLPDLSVLWGYLPISKILTLLFAGTASCKVPNFLLGLSLPAWSLLGFAILFCGTCWSARPK